jgi:hypothetical protein
VRASFGKWLGLKPAYIAPEALACVATDAIATRHLSHELHLQARRLLTASAEAWERVSDEWLRRQAAHFGPLTHHIQLRCAIVLRRSRPTGCAWTRGGAPPLPNNWKTTSGG